MSSHVVHLLNQQRYECWRSDMIFIFVFVFFFESMFKIKLKCNQIPCHLLHKPKHNRSWICRVVFRYNFSICARWNVKFFNHPIKYKRVTNFCTWKPTNDGCEIQNTGIWFLLGDVKILSFILFVVVVDKHQCENDFNVYETYPLIIWTNSSVDRNQLRQWNVKTSIMA